MLNVVVICTRQVAYVVLRHFQGVRMTWLPPARETAAFDWTRQAGRRTVRLIACTCRRSFVSTINDPCGRARSRGRVVTGCVRTRRWRGPARAPSELIISTDLPLQGASASTSESTNNMIELYLEQIGHKAGNYTIKLQTYDDSTAAKGAWDDARAKNATDHVANEAEVAVMGTYNSGCAQIQVPTLNQDSTGPMLMVSHQHQPGAVQAVATGDPDKYFPTGTRNYARVVTTDDYQGQGAAQFAFEDLKVKKAFVLNDNQTYGLGVAKAFAESAKKLGIEIVGEQAWDAKQPNYTALSIRRPRALIWSTSGHLRQQRRPADQGQGRGPRRQRR